MTKIGIGERGGSARETGHQNLCALLELAERLGGWLTADLAAVWIWPRTEKATTRKQAEALIRRAVKTGLLLPRALGGRRHAYVLTQAGARFVHDGMMEGTSGVRWGRIAAGEWLPPASFQHDERAARLLVSLAGQGWTVRTAYEIASANPIATKLPDGLASRDGTKWYWIEVEGARKTGPSMRRLIDEVIDIEAGRGPWLQLNVGNPERAQACRVLFVLPPDGLDDRGYRLRHKLRLESAMRARRLPGMVRLRFLAETGAWAWKKSHVDVVSVGREPDVASIALTTKATCSPSLVNKPPAVGKGIDLPERK